ncbi:unnamed protein product [Nyctereutes procyonoides]|uniref:(raccoon dog) hypothetical protein n=1 Tax=Nyctereutes procyonoides TaxID=34880 RepID=A0A811YV10_NYCPR|nr:unnamed protein product [Nyctereutes procyonoides]
MRMLETAAAVLEEKDQFSLDSGVQRRRLKSQPLRFRMIMIMMKIMMKKMPMTMAMGSVCGALTEDVTLFRCFHMSTPSFSYLKRHDSLSLSLGTLDVSWILYRLHDALSAIPHLQFLAQNSRSPWNLLGGRGLFHRNTGGAWRTAASVLCPGEEGAGEELQNCFSICCSPMGPTHALGLRGRALKKSTNRYDLENSTWLIWKSTNSWNDEGWKKETPRAWLKRRSLKKIKLPRRFRGTAAWSAGTRCPWGGGRPVP